MQTSWSAETPKAKPHVYGVEQGLRCLYDTTLLNRSLPSHPLFTITHDNMSPSNHPESVSSEPVTPMRSSIKTLARNAPPNSVGTARRRPKITILNKPVTTPVTPAINLRRIRPVLLPVSGGDTGVNALCAHQSGIETATVSETQNQCGTVVSIPPTSTELVRPVRKRLFADDQPYNHRQTRKPCIAIRGTGRTQPSTPRAQLSVLVSRLDNYIETALAACAAFHSFINSPDSSADLSFCNNALLLNVFRRVDNVFLTHSSDIQRNLDAPVTAVFVSQSMLYDISANGTGSCMPSSDRSYVLFVPQPWHRSHPYWLQMAEVESLITPFRVCLIEHQQVPLTASNIISNAALAPVDVAPDSHPPDVLPDVMDLSTNLQFSQIPSHCIQITIYVHIVFVLPMAMFAIAKDRAGDFAIYKFAQLEAPKLGELTLRDVFIAPYNLPARTISNLISLNFDDADTILSGLAQRAESKLIVLSTQTPT